MSLFLLHPPKWCMISLVIDSLIPLCLTTVHSHQSWSTTYQAVCWFKLSLHWFCEWSASCFTSRHDSSHGPRGCSPLVNVVFSHCDSSCLLFMVFCNSELWIISLYELHSPCILSGIQSSYIFNSWCDISQWCYLYSMARKRCQAVLLLIIRSLTAPMWALCSHMAVLKMALVALECSSIMDWSARHSPLVKERKLFRIFLIGTFLWVEPLLISL